MRDTTREPLGRSHFDPKAVQGIRTNLSTIRMHKGDNGTSFIHQAFGSLPNDTRVAGQIGRRWADVLDGRKVRYVNFEVGLFQSGSKFGIAFGNVPAAMDYEDCLLV